MNKSTEEQGMDWRSAVPMPDGADNIRTTVTASGGTVLSVWEDVQENELCSYKNKLINNGFKVVSEYALGDNSYILFESTLITLYLSYINAMNTARIYAEPRGLYSYPPSTQGEYSVLDGQKPLLWQVNVDTRHALGYDPAIPVGKQGGNGGMAYAVQVSDGSFVLIDSGVYTYTQADILYDLLKKNSPHDKPVISAWIFTHNHGDHTAGFKKFTLRYAELVTVKAFYLNFPEKDWEGIRSFTEQYPNAAVYRNLQAGMRFYVADAQFDVIYSYYDRYFADVAITEQCRPGHTRPLCSIDTDSNNNSIVIRMTLGGQRVMFLGDVEEEGSRIIEKSISEVELSSDIVQLSHHGWEGGTRELYDMIGASTVLWPIGIYSWQHDWFGGNIFKRLIRTSHPTNRYVAVEAPYVKTVICYGEGTVKLTLPYTPRDKRLPEYEAIYEAIKAVEESMGNRDGAVE